MVKYKLIADGIKKIKCEDGIIKYEFNIIGVKDNESGMFIPFDLANRHYQEYQEWLKQGNEPDPPYTFNELKQIKKSEIKLAFQKAIMSDFMYSQTLQKNVNIGDEHLRNVENLIDYMQINNITEIQFRVYDNSFVIITLNQLQSLKLEMIQYRLDLYQKKWRLEQQIDEATTEDVLLTIVW